MQIQPTIFAVEEDIDVGNSVACVAIALGIGTRRFSSARETLNFCSPEMPGCFVLDYEVAGTSGLHLRQQLTAKGCQQPFIFLAPRGDVGAAVAAMHLGAVECIEKPVDRQQLLSCVQRAIECDSDLRRRRADAATASRNFGSLTDRERQVVTLVASGKLTKEIAKILGISPKTVEVHRSNLMRKMQVDSAARLVHLIARFSLLPLSPPTRQPDVPIRGNAGNRSSVSRHP